MVIWKLLLDYKRHYFRVYWIYTFTCLLYFLDYSHGGYQEIEDELHDHDSQNMIPTEDPFKLLTNLKRLEPYFDPNVNQNVTALVGKSAYLNCVVKNLGNKTVSWIRARDLHILTVSTYTYTTDLRFQTTHHRTTDEWTLQIKWVQKRDAGLYDCQVSSQPIKSYSVYLNVIVPTAVIIGGPEYFISKGSTINLTCIIKYSPDPPNHTYWHFRNKILSFDSEPRLSQLSENGDTFTNYLLITNVNSNDSGKYTCAPSNADPASIMVHVVNGENPEAYSSSSQLSSCCYAPYTIITLSLLLHLLYNYTVVLSRNSTKLDNCYDNDIKSHMNLKDNR
ncbi:protein CEPU-1-like isoform X2 [Chironomus tepperi]|uniref:protein CEPU-1-like isoform X2 n=1 Tax=Chironomus tepperi TaxID=113505 RepID=UPI00391FA86B